MPWRGPEHDGDFPSLGWDLLDWYSTYLRVPSGPKTGEPLVLTDEQARFIVRLYMLDRRSGRMLFRRAGLRRVKGWGKSPLLAAWALGCLCGPVQFDGWDAEGEPVGVRRPSPWVQIAALSEDQTDNTYSALLEMLGADSPAVDEFGLDAGLTRVYLTDGPGRIEPVTASAGSREGQPVTDGVLDETHLWVPSNGGERLAKVIRRNVAKMSGLTVESTNAFVPGERSVAEDTEAAADRGARGIFLDRGPVIPKVNDIGDAEEMLPALRVAYGDATWVDLDRIFEEANDPDTGVDNARRFYLNELVKAAAQLFDARRWRDDLARPGESVPAGELVAIGFDGARFHDATAMVATHVRSGFQWPLAIVEQPLNAEEDWQVDEQLFDDALESAMGRWEVWRVYCDPPYWQEKVNDWAGRWPDQIVSWWTHRNRQMAFAVRAYREAQRGGDVTHDGDATFARHIENARRKDTLILDERGHRMPLMQKEFPQSSNKIDAAMAGCLSWEARGDAIADGALNRPAVSKEVVFF